MAEENPTTPPAPAPKPAPEPEVFSKDYVRELRQESQNYRTRAQEAADKAKEAEDRAKAAEAERDEKISATQQSANDRIIRAELKAAAIKAGMIDLDGLKLADLSSVKLGEDGEVEGAEDLMKALKESKPYLFGDSSTTTNTEKKPAPKEPEKVDVTKMTPEEYKEYRRKMTSGR